MNKLSLPAKFFLAIAVFNMATLSAYATTAKEFIALPDNKQWDLLTSTANDLSAKLRSEYDSKGNRKSREVIEKQKDLARFIVKLFDERDSTGLPVNYSKIYSLIYYASLNKKDADTGIDRLVLAFATERYKEKQAAISGEKPKAK